MLTRAEAGAAYELIRRVRETVPADLVHVVLFGSKARVEARPDSDVDLLFIFADLPPDREPQASMVEDLAEAVSERARVEVGPWSVALVDLEQGMRTPMLVDALTDGIPLWPHETPSPRIRFTPPDALRCTAALLERVEEGSREAAHRLSRGQSVQLAKRLRDDLVRLWTALLLLDGETRPRKAEVAERALVRERPPLGAPRRALLEWVIRSYGPTGRSDNGISEPPPLRFRDVAEEIDHLRARVARRRELLAGGLNRRNGRAEESLPRESGDRVSFGM